MLDLKLQPASTMTEEEDGSLVVSPFFSPTITALPFSTAPPLPSSNEEEELNKKKNETTPTSSSMFGSFFSYFYAPSSTSTKKRPVHPSARGVYAVMNDGVMASDSQKTIDTDATSLSSESNY